MPRWTHALLWTVVAALGAGALGYLALSRGEQVNAAWLLTAAVCTYLVGYRFYSRIIAAKIFALDASRATPAAVFDLIAGLTPLRRVTTPAEFADAVLFFLSPWGRAVTGQNLVVDCGLVKD